MLKTSSIHKPDTFLVYKTMRLLGYMKRLVLVQQVKEQQVKEQLVLGLLYN